MAADLQIGDRGHTEDEIEYICGSFCLLIRCKLIC